MKEWVFEVLHFGRLAYPPEVAVHARTEEEAREAAKVYLSQGEYIRRLISVKEI